MPHPVCLTNHAFVVHEVIEQVDRGETVLSQPVVIEEGETLEHLTSRLHDLEHELIVKATAQKSQEIVNRKEQAK